MRTTNPINNAIVINELNRQCEILKQKVINYISVNPIEGDYDFMQPLFEELKNKIIVELKK